MRGWGGGEVGWWEGDEGLGWGVKLDGGRGEGCRGMRGGLRQMCLKYFLFFSVVFFKIYLICSLVLPHYCSHFSSHNAPT